MRALALVATAVALVFLYGALSRSWTPIGGTHAQFMRLEVPLFIFVAWLGYVRLAAPSMSLGFLVDWLFACLPPLLLFILLDGGYRYLHRCLRVSDLLELHGLFEASPALAASVVAVLGGAAMIPVVRAALLFRRASIRALLVWSIPRMIAIALFVAAATSNGSAMQSYVIRTVQYEGWTEQEAMGENGRFAAALCLYVRRSIALERVRGVDLSTHFDRRFDRRVAIPRNVYVLVLESLIDPRLLDDVYFNQSPLHPRMRALLGGEGDFDTVTVPAYGGGTAQTEFELLSGLPALGRVESIEFNALEGHPVPSLVSALRERGYKTIATIAATRTFYNGPRAYRSLGFEELHFLDGSSYLGQSAGDELFDGELLDKNLEYVSSNFLEHGYPFLNYVVGLYGHHPYVRDRDKRPDVCLLVPDGDGSTPVERVANQFYYRTEALAAYLEAVRERDPSAIVFVTSDHLPPLLDTGLRYRYEATRNICLSLEADRRVELSGEPVFHVPYVLFSELCGARVPVPSATELERDYFATMAAGLGLAPR